MTEAQDPRLQHLVHDSARRSFGPGFADRVMQRVQDEGSALDRLLIAQFLPLAASVLLVALGLGAYSLFGAEPYEEQSPLEAVLGLEPVTVEALLQVDALAPIATESGDV